MYTNYFSITFNIIQFYIVFSHKKVTLNEFFLMLFTNLNKNPAPIFIYYPLHVLIYRL